MKFKYIDLTIDLSHNLRRKNAMNKNKIVPGTGGERYVPYEERTGNESIVYFTRRLSAEGLVDIYRRISANLRGKVAVKRREKRSEHHPSPVGQKSAGGGTARRKYS